MYLQCNVSLAMHGDAYRISLSYGDAHHYYIVGLHKLIFVKHEGDIIVFSISVPTGKYTVSYCQHKERCV